MTTQEHDLKGGTNMPQPAATHCLVYGSPFNDNGGYTIVGPFASYKDARDYAGQASERNEDDDWTEEFVIVDLYPRHPREAR